VISVIVFFLLFLLPFVIAPFGVTQFENPKVIAAEIGIILLLLISIFRAPSIRALRALRFVEMTRNWMYVVVILLTVIDLLFFRTSLSFFGNAFRMQGIFLLWMLLLFSFLSAHIQLKKIPWVVVFGLLLAEVIATVFLPLNESQRYVGTLGEPNASAAVMLFLWPFLWFSLPKDTWRHRLILFSALFCVMLIIYLTASRSALIGLIIQIVFLLLLWLKRKMKTAVLICLCLFLASFSLVFLQKDVLYENRLEVWTAGYFAGLSHPILGGGFGNTELLLQKEAQEHHLRVRYYYVDSAHNIFLDWWAQGGIIGLGALCFFIFSAFKRFVIAKEKRNIVLLLGLLTALSFNPASVVGLVQLWWLIGNGVSD